MSNKRREDRSSSRDPTLDPRLFRISSSLSLEHLKGKN